VLRVDAPRLEIKSASGGHLQADGSIVASEWTLTGADAVTIAAPVLELALGGDAVPGGRATLRVEAPDLTASLAAQSFSIEKMKAEIDGVTLRGSMTGTSIFAGPELAGSLVLDAFSPRSVLGQLGLPASTADPAALTHAQASARYVVRGGGLELDDLALALDDTQLTGTVTVRDFASAVGPRKATVSPAPEAADNDVNAAPKTSDGAALRFDLAADRLDLDRYLPPAPGGAGRGAVSDPLARLQALVAGRDAEGTLRVGMLELGDLRATDAVLGFHAQPDERPDAPSADGEAAPSQPAAAACEPSGSCVTPAAGAARAATEQ
jgi:hypothetical protein